MTAFFVPAQYNPFRFFLQNPVAKAIFHHRASQQNTADGINEAFMQLKKRKDNDALKIFERILSKHPDNLDALWGKAEVLRRNYDLEGAKSVLENILKNNPGHIPSRISLSYLVYNDNDLELAQRIIDAVLKEKDIDRQNQALAYIMLGMISSKRASGRWLLEKIKSGIQIRNYFLMANDLAPDLPEAHLGLGTFYLLAPPVLGGNNKKAIEELELTVTLAPEFASANIRLAQAYKKSGANEKYNFYIARAREIDPNNEFLKDLGNIKY